jgi:type IV secretion system protein VirB1
MIASVALFSQLWASCVGPIVAVETGASVARAESDFDTLAVHDNTTGRSYTPITRAEAVAIATTLRHAGDSLDLGLMQVNTANLVRFGLSIPAAFDACRNMAAGAQILLDSYLATDGKRSPQIALRQALSRYNTGDSAAGFANGYVARVENAAVQVVPAIRVQNYKAGSLPGKSSPSQSKPNSTPAANGLIDGLVHQGSGSDGDGTPAIWSGDPLIHPTQAGSLSEHAAASAPSHLSSTANGSAHAVHS